jgi:hypothetical protein
MALTTEEKRLIDNATPGLARVKLSEKIEALQAATQPATTTVAGIVKKGAAVADAAGAAPTAAEFKALLDSLRAAGVIASS